MRMQIMTACGVAFAGRKLLWQITGEYGMIPLNSPQAERNAREAGRKTGTGRRQVQ